MWLFNESYAVLARLHPFLMGATGALSLIASVLFFRFYRKTADRLFLFFSAAFTLMALNRLAFQFADSPNESEPALYLVRLLAFCLILFAIADKNRSRRIRKTRLN